MSVLVPWLQSTRGRKDSFSGLTVIPEHTQALSIWPPTSANYTGRNPMILIMLNRLRQIETNFIRLDRLAVRHTQIPSQMLC